MKKISKEYWFIVITGIIFGLVVFGGKVLANLGLSLYEISVLPFAFATLILFVLLVFKKECHLRKEMFWLLLFYGLVYLFVTVAQFGAVIMGLSVAMTVLLLYTQPVWTILFSAFFLKTKIAIRDIVSCAIVLLGMFILINPFQGGATNNWIGIILALIGGISLSGWVLIGSVLSKRGNHPLNSLFIENFLMIVILLLLYPLAKMTIYNESLARLSLHFTPLVWCYILVYGLMIGVVSQLFYLNGIKKVSAVDAGIILLLEPISGSLLATIFLRQAITLNIIIGGFLILFANYLVLTKSTKKSKN